MNVTAQPPLETLMVLLAEVSLEGSIQMTVGGLRRELDSENASMDLYIRDIEGTFLTLLRVDFIGLLEFSLDQEIFEDLNVAAAGHPLLWPYVERHGELYFYAPAKDPRLVIAALHEIHDRTVKNWFSLARFTNDLLPLQNLLAASSGRLAGGPLPLIRVYEEVLREAELKCSVLESAKPRWPVPQHAAEGAGDPVALLMGTSYILARGLGKVQSLNAAGQDMATRILDVINPTGVDDSSARPR